MEKGVYHMPKMTESGKQIKVWLPDPLYAELSQEAQDTGRKMAEIVREQMADRYYQQSKSESEAPASPCR